MRRRTQPLNKTRRKCPTRKIRYPSYHEAMRSVNHPDSRGGEPSEYVPTRAYECGRCHGWHLTSKQYLPTIAARIAAAEAAAEETP